MLNLTDSLAKRRNIQYPNTFDKDMYWRQDILQFTDKRYCPK